MTKKCSKCKQELPLDAFYLKRKTDDPTKRRNRHGYCKECTKANVIEWQKKYKDRANAKNNRWKKENPDKVYAYNCLWQKLDKEKHPEKWSRRWLRKDVKKYGITLEQYEQMVASQSNLCAICRKPPHNTKTRLTIDHDHNTGKVRGLLCGSCNWAIERLDAVPDWNVRASAYLQLYRE